MPPYIEAINDWAQLILTLGAVIALIKTVSQNVQAPDKAQDARISNLEKRMDKVDERLENGTTHFKSIDKGNEVTASALVAILDALITGDNKTELEKAKGKLNDYLISGKK